MLAYALIDRLSIDEQTNWYTANTLPTEYVPNWQSWCTWCRFSSIDGPTIGEPFTKYTKSKINSSEQKLKFFFYRLKLNDLPSYEGFNRPSSRIITLTWNVTTPVTAKHLNSNHINFNPNIHRRSTMDATRI